MVASIEFLRDQSHIGSLTGRYWLSACVEGAQVAGIGVVETQSYRGTCDWLCVFGVGDPDYSEARRKHMAKGKRVICWDIGYFGQRTADSLRLTRTATRVSVDHDHPLPALLDKTVPDPSRWLALGKTLREDADPSGPVVVIGIGPKSRLHLNEYGWERRALFKARERFPNRLVLYRSKPVSPKRNPQQPDPVVWDNYATGRIEDVLQGASLVICKHSNVAMDACIAGVPVECEDGAAFWLYRKGSTPTREQRVDFLCRVCWWEWKFMEMDKAWVFLRSALDATKQSEPPIVAPVTFV